jgi:hypothetical protein
MYLTHKSSRRLAALGGGIAAFAVACAESAPPQVPAGQTAPVVATSAANTAANMPATTAKVAVTTPPSPAACIIKTSARRPTTYAGIDRDRATLCFDAPASEHSETPEGPSKSPEPPDACIAVTLATGTVSGTSFAPPKTPVASDAKATGISNFDVVATTATIKICKHGTAECKVVRTQQAPIPPGHTGDADHKPSYALSEDGARLFVFALVFRRGADPTLTTSWTIYGDLFEVATGKRLRHDLLTRSTPNTSTFTDPSNTRTATFVGKNLLLGDYVCCGPAGTSMLYDVSNGRTQYVHGYGGDFTQVVGAVYAARDENKVTLFDADTLTKLPGEVACPAHTSDDSDPEDQWTDMAVSPTKVVVSCASPPAYAVIDVASKRASSLTPLPLCP